MTEKITIYYHIWAPQSDVLSLLIDEQIKRLIRAGLHKKALVLCTISGPGFDIAIELISLYSWIEIIEHNQQNDYYEGMTLKHIYRDCLAHKTDKVMYMHTKGISLMSDIAKSHFSDSPSNSPQRRLRAINSWRHYLEWGCIDHWEKNVKALDSSDLSGVGVCRYPWVHFTGNFFWANADYIRTLIHPIDDPFPSCPNNYYGHKERLVYERWIGLNDPKINSLHNPPFWYDRQGMKPDIDLVDGEADWFWLYRDDIFPHISFKPEFTAVAHHEGTDSGLMLKK